MPNVSNSHQVRISPATGQIADYVLNHPTASPFQKHNISFHIDGNYLSDFSQRSIKDFVGDHNSKLSHQEVNAFVQTVAANASELAGATFDLNDRELGLFKDDKVNEQHIRTGFMLETKSGSLPSQGVVFFDANKSTFPLKDIEATIKQAQERVKVAEKDVKKATGKVEDAQWERQSLVDFLGKDSPKILAEKQSRVSDLGNKLVELNEERESYTTELRRLENDHNNGAQTPGMNQSQRWQRITELKRALRGLDVENKESSRELDKTKESISKKQGPLSFIGVGNSLAQLHERNQKLKTAQMGLQASRTQLDSARGELNEAKALRERILKGEGLFPPKPPAAQPPAQPPTPPAAQPPAPPVAEEPTPPPAQPPAPPVAEEPVAPQQPVEPIAPAPPAQPAPVAEEPAPVPAQPPAQPPAPPVAEAPAQPTHPAPDGYEPIVPIHNGNQHNPILINEPVQPAQPAPVQPAPAQPAPVSAVPSTPAPAQPQPVAPVSPPSSIGDGSVSKLLYTVKRGDTLSSIAQTELGSWKRWREIADTNRDVIGTQNNHWIYPGQVLTLPPLNVKPRPTS